MTRLMIATFAWLLVVGGAATALTLGASALQKGHHGVQNHNTAGLPAKLDPAKGAPARVVPVN